MDIGLCRTGRTADRARRRTLPRVLACTAAVAALAGALAAAHAAEIVFADGRHETVQDPRRDSKGVWLATRDGHRTALKPGDVVAIIDDAGTETVTIPALADPPDAPDATAALASIRDPKDDAWLGAAERLAARPTQALVDALVALASDTRKDLRSRAVTALARLRTRESVVAAATAVLAEKDPAVRREAVNALFSVWEIFRRAPTQDLVRRGIADKERDVRIAFATLSAHDDAAATAVLRKEGLSHPDHHFRESAAVELGLRGDGSGESVLLGMLSRSKLPGIDDAALMERLMIREKVQICGILGKLATDAGKAALRKAAASGPEAVRKAAEAALAAASDAAGSAGK